MRKYYPIIHNKIMLIMKTLYIPLNYYNNLSYYLIMIKIIPYCKTILKPSH